MSITTGTTDVIGGGYPSAFAGGYGGLGNGIGLIGLLGINSFFGRDGFGNGRVDGLAGTTVLEQNVSELRKDVQGVNTEVHKLGNEIAASQAAQTNALQADFRNLDNQICDVEKTQLQSAYAASLQAFQNTQAIQNQVTAFQVANDLQFCAIKSQINADGDATRALINQNLIDDLRGQLALERRGRDLREIEINVTQTSQQTQNQLQAQLQTQSQVFANALGLLGDQINRQANQLINVGSGVVSGSPQNNNNANTKINP